MAEKILKIKLVADTSGATSVLKEFEKQNQTEREYQKLLQQKKDLFEQLQVTIANQNSFIEKGIQNQGLAWYNAERALAKYSNSIAPLASRLKELKTELDRINSGTNLLASSAKTDTRGYTRNSQGTVAENRLREQEALNAAALSRFSSFLSEQEKRLAASIERQKAIQIHGINSIEAKRAQALEAERRLQVKLQQDLANIQNRISSGTISKGAGGLEAKNLLSNYRKGILAANSALLEQEQAHERAQGSFKRLALRILEIVGIYRIYNTIFNQVANSIKAIPQIGIQVEATKAILASTTDNSTIAGNIFENLTKEAKRAGLELGTVRESFRTFNASATLAGESLESVWRMFTNINTVSAALHLTTDQTNHVFLALAQIFNKNKVQSEELVKQLGNLLPGAFASFAAANKDMFKNTAELITAMKAGTVFAHETVEKFTNFLATRFGAAFGLASQGLNANINRMKTSFRELSEEIYGSTSGSLVRATKLLTSFADYLKDGVKNGNLLLNTISGLVKTGLVLLIASLGKAVLSWALLTKTTITYNATAVVTTTKFVQLQRAMAFLSSPAAIITGITLIITKLRDLVHEQDDALESFRKFHEEFNKPAANAPIFQQLDFAIKNDPDVQQLQQLVENLEARKKILEKTSTKIINSFSSSSTLKAQQEHLAITNELEQAYKDLDLAIARAREGFVLTNKQLSVEAQAAILTARETAKIESLGAQGTPEALREQARLQKAKQLKEEIAGLSNNTRALNAQINETFSDKTLTQAEKFTKILNINKEISANKTALKELQYAIDNAGKTRESKGIKTPAIKENRLALANLERENKTAIALREQEIADLDAKNKQGLISFQEYLTKKEELILKEIELNQTKARKAMIDSQKAGDKAAFEKAQDEFSFAEVQGLGQLKSLENSLNDEQAAFNAKLDEAHAKFLQLNGVAEAFQQKYEAQNKEFVNRLDSEIAAGNTRALQIKNEIALTNQLEGVKERLALVDEKVNAEDIRHTNALNRINILTEQGTMSQLEAFQAQTKENERNLQILNQLIAAKEKEIALVPKSLQATAEYQSLINQLEQLKNQFLETKLAANALTSHIKTTFQQSFSQAFASVITGSSTAKDAFKSFVQAILEEMANLLASAIASQFVKLFEMLFAQYPGEGGFLGALSHGFGLLPSSKGNIVSNNNIVPFAKGGIPDIGNKMQYFPLANGGIGSLRENNKYEAILPLHRDASCSLGVKANLGNNSVAPSGGNVYNITVHVQGSKEDKASDVGDKVAEAIVRRIAREEAGKMQRNTSYANKNQKFG